MVGSVQIFQDCCFSGPVNSLQSFIISDGRIDSDYLTSCVQYRLFILIYPYGNWPFSALSGKTCLGESERGAGNIFDWGLVFHENFQMVKRKNEESFTYRNKEVINYLSKLTISWILKIRFLIFWFRRVENSRLRSSVWC